MLGLSLVRVRILRVSRYLVWCGLLVSAAYGQEKPSQPDKLAYAVDPANVPDAIAYLKSGKFAAVRVDMIIRAGAVEAIPSLTICACGRPDAKGKDRRRFSHFLRR